MKLSLFHKIIIAVTAAFIFFTAGFAIGHSKGETVINVHVSKLTADYVEEISGKSDDLRIIVDVNTAGIEELMLLPKMDSKTALSIIDHRTALGGFSDIRQVRNAEGVTFAMWHRIKSHIIV